MLLAVVVLAPLPAGAVFQWAWAANAVAIGVLLGLWALAIALGRRSLLPPSRPLRAAAALYGLVLLWVLVQTLPVTPPAWHHEVWALFGSGAGAGNGAGAVSLDPEAGRGGLVRLMTYAAVFWLALQFGHRSRRVVQGLAVFAAAGAVYAAYGIAAQLLFPGGGLWLFAPGNPDAVSATFVNRNVFAGYAGLGLLAVLALGVRGLGSLSAVHGPRRALAAALVAQPRALFLLTAAAAVIGAALLLSASRGGMASFLAAAALFAMILARGGGRRTMWAGLIVFGGLAAVLLAAAGEPLVGRIGEATLSLDGRLEAYRLAWQAILERPLLGYGLGAFAEQFAMIGGREIGNYAYAHNLYLETAFELGLPALAALIAAFALVCTAALGGPRRGQGRGDPAFLALAPAVIALVGLHGAVDSTADIPAVGLAVAFLTGLGSGYALAHRPSRRNEDSGTAQNRSA